MAVTSKFPSPYKKVFFQCELRQFSNGDATFGLIAYGGYKQAGNTCGPKVSLADDPDGEDRIVDEWPLAFANLEFGIKGINKKKGKVYSKIIKLLK